MQICYIAATVTPNMSPDQMGWWEKTITNAISKAITATIVEPFKAWCLNMWIGFVNISLPICVTGTLLGIILYMCGVKKGLTWSIVSVIIYLFIRAIDYMMLVGF